MLFQEAINSWTLQISTFFDYKNVDPQLKNNEINDGFTKKRFIKNESDVFIGYMILFWSFFFLIYKKWLNKLLRRKCFPLIQRNRIISTIWDCIFSVITINYLLYIFSLSSKSSMFSKMTKLNVLLYKSFYIHQAGVNIFIFGSWMKGLSTLLFAFFAFHPSSERLDPSILLLLFLKVIDTSILSACRFLLCFWNKKIHILLVKTLFIFHCLTWSYLYIYFVPKYIFWGSNSRNPSEKFQIWMWFISECWNSVWLKLFEGFDVYFFPPLSKDSIEFVNRIKEQKALLKKQPNVQSKRKAELLKTVTCVMSLKKKLHRMRKAKEAKLGIESYIKDEKNEGHDKITQQKEVMQSLLCEKRNSRDSQAVPSNDYKETDFESSEIEEKIDQEHFEETETMVQETSV